MMRTVLMSLCLTWLAGCSIVYRLPTRQGNLIEQKQFDQLKVGQTRSQVRYLVGTPIASSLFSADRWTYYGYYKDPRGKVATRTINLFFDGDKLARAEGVEVAAAGSAVDGEAEAIVQEENKNNGSEAPSTVDNSRPTSGRRGPLVEPPTTIPSN